MIIIGTMVVVVDCMYVLHALCTWLTTNDLIIPLPTINDIGRYLPI